ncbi:hypothetical protein E0500_042430 [Streptomyces sp. KM273126]|uniref:hypothetical protein n=1 Tax=Streptomyces sp. KM273126 TaxID=2545247 RepID=UPI00103C91D5|nr:hypothetical protein [Streptomyces sp. KM273126]MBA2813793.1 hypothetical protein [Streptomyces sp. KM273126]
MEVLILWVRPAAEWLVGREVGLAVEMADVAVGEPAHHGRGEGFGELRQAHAALVLIAGVVFTEVRFFLGCGFVGRP